MSSPGPFTGYGPRRGPRFGTSISAQYRAGIAAESVGDAPRKTDCPGHAARVDNLGRWPIGDCGPDCLMRRYRLGTATYKNGTWT